MEHLPPGPQDRDAFLNILKDPFSRKLFGHEAVLQGDRLSFTGSFTTRLDFLIRNPANHLSLFNLGYTCLESFLQSNVTGPPLAFDPEDVIFPKVYHASMADIRRQMFASLTVQGDAIYSLTPHVELFWVAKTILSKDGLCEGFNGRRARVRVNFWHQSLLSEPSDLLRDEIYQDAEILEGQLNSRFVFRGAGAESQFIEFLVEQAIIDTYYGDDVQARAYLAKAAKLRGFEFALTGALGKRTKFQDRDISQLVVLAKSGDEVLEEQSPQRGSGTVSPTDSPRCIGAHVNARKGGHTELYPLLSEAKRLLGSPNAELPNRPANIPLNDDTLLESIHFAPPKLLPEILSDDRVLPPSLAALDPSAQSLLHPFDSIILLQIASSISNTSPSDGLTREETLPYASRVLEGGSSNWQVYTQALLVRSRIEGYRSRTAERGLLQLQALVDQVIVETSDNTKTCDISADDASLDSRDSHSTASITPRNPRSDRPSPSTSGPSSFLPAARASELAPVEERLKYVHQLHPPLRWELESELAARWVSMGGLKTALEIYERLQMHAEVALCLAATNNERKAIGALRKLLFQPCGGNESDDDDLVGRELDVLPSDAPRLFCILGDLEDSPRHYERAWTVSNGRYARAQRSLGRYYVRKKNYPAAAAAYAKSLAVNRLNASTWFALGCVQLELEAFGSAVESFTRTVQLDAEDAEAWSNLAAALLRLPGAEQEGPEVTGENPHFEAPDSCCKDKSGTLSQCFATVAEVGYDPNKARKEALRALRRAASLRYDNPRIWDNYLTVAASIPPPDTPWSDIILAQKRVIAIRGKSEGEKAVDEEILTVLVRYVTQEIEYPGRPASGESPKCEALAAGAREDSVADSERPRTRSEEQKGEREREDERAGQLPRGSIARQVIELVDVHVSPLITASPALWLLVSDLNLWRDRPLAALEAQEKAWRCVTSQPGVYENEHGKRGWSGAVDATIRLVKAYEELGEKQRERGFMPGEDETAGRQKRELVARDWRFKARAAVRGVMGRGKGLWEETEGWERLVQVLEKLNTGGQEGS